MSERLEETPEEITQVEKGEKQTESSLARLARIMKQIGPLLALTLLPGISWGAGKREKAQQPEDQTTAQRIPGVPMGTYKIESGREYNLGGGIRTTFMTEDSKGQERFNWWSLVAPLEGELNRGEKEKRKEKFTIPYQYARLFAEDPHKRSPLRPEDHQKLERYVDQQLKKELADRLYGASIRKGHPEAYWGTKTNLENVEILDITVTGLASPEGPASKGPGTIEPGAIDEENLALAMERGKEGLERVITQLEKGGAKVDRNVLKKAAENVKAREVQFTDNEMAQLGELSKDYPGATPQERILSMIFDYNDDKITDPETVKDLDQIIARGRGIIVEIGYNNKQESKLFLPLPLLLLLLLVPRILRRPRPDEPEISTGGDIDKPKPIEKGKIIDDSQEKLKKIPLPKEGSIKYEEMEESTYIDDLSQNIYNPETIRKGINYRAMADEMLQRYGEFKDNEERELYLAQVILNAWRSHDLLCRQESGIGEDQLEIGLDYDQQPERIQWARFHGRALLGLVEGKRALPPSKRDKTEYFELLEPKVRELKKRRILRPHGLAD